MNRILREVELPKDTRLQLVQGDITKEEVDAIVNAANAYLQHGGGVAGAISQRGGEVIQKESNEWVREHGPVPHDQPAITSAGRLPCRYVIHAVGPVWGSGEEDVKLAQAVSGALRVANAHSLRSIAMPAISCGIFGFPKERAAHLILKAIIEFFASTPSSKIKLVRIVLLDLPTLNAFLDQWDIFFSPKGEGTSNIA